MTALDDYAKLEAAARYFDGVSARPREVVLSFGERTLMIVGYDDLPIAHWPLASLRGVGDPGGRVTQLVPDLASDERVALDDPEMIDAINRVCPNLYHRPPSRRKLRRVAVWSAAALASVALILLILIPALADRLAVYVPPEREQALGDAIAAKIGDILGGDAGSPTLVCTAPEGTRALERMVGRLTPPSGLPYPLRVSVIDNPLVNAVALPGGRVLVFRGLLEVAETPEEVAGVLAHEFGHVINRDPTRGVLRAAGTAGIIGIMLGDVFGASVIAAASDAILNAKHQREAEILADEAAYRSLASAGLPSRSFARFFERLDAQHGAVAGPLRYVASHPGAAGRAERAAAADTIGDGTFTPVLTDRDWIALGNICDQKIELGATAGG